MTELDELCAISAVAADIEHFTDAQREHLWLRLCDADETTRRIYKRAVEAVRLKRIVMAEPANKLAA